MSKILYDAETMKYSSLFEMLTRTMLKDCFKEEEGIVFVVMPGYMAKAIGKNGINVKKITNAIKKNVRIIEFSSDVIHFINNLVRVEGINILQEGSDIIIKCPDTKTKGLVFGRDKERLRKLVDVVKRYFPINDIKVE